MSTQVQREARAIQPTQMAAVGATQPSTLAVEDVSKRFGGALALDRVSLHIQEGEVLALCGANGAGKSTLIKILAGVEHADEGHVLVDGREVTIGSPRQSTDLGLSFVHQELNLVPSFTAMQNMALGLPGRAGFVDRRLRNRAHEVGELLGHQVDLDTPVDRLSVAERWMVSLSRSLMRPARIVAMDEPTASFTSEEAEHLYRVIAELTRNGVGIIYISHRLEEVLQLSDRVTVLRNGRNVDSLSSSDLDVAKLTHLIVGQEVECLEQQGPQHAPDPTIQLSVRGLTREPAVRSVDFDLHRGEILGMAGLVGSGRTEIAQLLVGADTPASGSVVMDGVELKVRSPHSAIRRGIALVPEERRSQGLLLHESVSTNLALAAVGAASSLARPQRPSTHRGIARDLMERFGIKARSVRTPVQHLSGGNQQKVVVGKNVRTKPRVLILDEPTVGVDVGARAEIYRIISDLAAEGTSVLMISSDFEELAICHRVMVVRDGTVVATVAGPEASKDRLTRLCFGSNEEEMS